MKKSYLKAFILFLILASVSFLFSGCGQVQPGPAGPVKEPVAVEAKTLADSRVLIQTLKYPAIVTADQEASLIAKAAGTVKEADFTTGDKVKIGQVLAKIDDVSAGSAGSPAGFSTAQIRQASIGVEQAAASYRQALMSYQDALGATEKDLAQVEIAKDQAVQGKENLILTATENFKSAELAYETAQIAAEQARLNLESRRSIASQSEEDIRTNAETAANSVADTAGQIINSINNLAGFDEDRPVSISYKNNLGALEVNSYANAEQQYKSARGLYDRFIPANFTRLNDRVEAAVLLAENTKNLADKMVGLLDKTVVSQALPQTSNIPGAVSLSGLWATMAGFQSQLTGALSQINAAKQGLANLGLANDSTLTALEKYYEIARAQEASARQNLENLRAVNKSQQDQAAFGVAAAANQYESAKIRLNTQLSLAKTQLDIAELSYRNAQVALQSAYDSHLLVSPINGTVTKKLVSQGDTVSFGQLLAVVSEPSSVKLTFYVDRENLPYLSAGQGVQITYNGSEPVAGAIAGISLSADDMTKRFLVEVRPARVDGVNFALGTIMNVTVKIEKTAQAADTLILPITAVEIGQNKNSILIVKDGKAVKYTVEIVRVEGEAVEIKAALPPDALVIVKNNKLLQEGDPVKISNF